MHDQEQGRPSTASATGKSATEAIRAAASAESATRPSRFADKRPVLLFVVLFGVFLGSFYGVTFIPKVSNGWIPAYMRFNAAASVVVLNWFDEQAVTRGATVSSPRFSVDIAHGCDAIAPSLLLLSAVLAFPARIMTKLPGILLGTVVLAIVNLIRIVSLFYAGIHWPRRFETIHVDVWQPFFVVLSLTLWVAWAWWATRPRKSPIHDAA